MVPRMVPEISSLDAFCDTAAGAGAGIGDSRSWIWLLGIVSAKSKADLFWDHFGYLEIFVARSSES